MSLRFITKMKIDLKSSVHRNIRLLQICAIWPVKNSKHFLKYRILLAVASFIYNLTAIMYIVQTARSMTEIASSCYITVYSLDIVTKAIIFMCKRTEIEEVIDNMGIKEFQPKNFNQKKIITKVMWLSGLMVPGFVTMVVLSLVLYGIAFFMSKHQGLIFDAWFPYDVSSSLTVYVLTFAFQVVTAGFETFSSFGIDSFFSVLMLHIGGQCDVLCDGLAHLGRDTSRNLRTELDILINHYQQILV